MSKKLFVGGLAYSITSEELKKLFSTIGAVLSADVIFDKFTNQSKGFGFVEMENDEDADKAIKKLNDTDVSGRKIIVSIARPREDRPRFDNRNNGRGGNDRGKRGWRSY